MIRSTMIVAGLACWAMFSSCKADDATTKTDESPQTATASAPAEAEPAAAEAPTEPAAPEARPSQEGRFGGLVAGATTVTVTQRQADGEADYGGTPRTVDDAEWIAKFVTAVGPTVPGSEAVPRCIPNYNLTFANADGEIASFGAVCAGLETVVLVRDGAAYSAGDDATVGQMLRDLASEAAPAAE